LPTRQHASKPVLAHSVTCQLVVNPKNMEVETGGNRLTAIEDMSIWCYGGQRIHTYRLPRVLGRGRQEEKERPVQAGRRKR